MAQAPNPISLMFNPVFPSQRYRMVHLMKKEWERAYCGPVPGTNSTPASANRRSPAALGGGGRRLGFHHRGLAVQIHFLVDGQKGHPHRKNDGPQKNTQKPINQ